MKQQSINEVIAANSLLSKAWELLKKAESRESKRNLKDESSITNIRNVVQALHDTAKAQIDIEEIVQEPENSLIE